MNLGVAYAMKHEDVLALEQYQHALELDPSYSIGYYNLALLYKSMDKPNDAIQALRKSLDGTANDRRVHALLGDLCRDSGDSIGAVEEYEAVLDGDPNDHKIHLQLGLAQLKRDVRRIRWLVRRLRQRHGRKSSRRPPRSSSSPGGR